MEWLVTWGHSPWGDKIPTHVAWSLFWAALIAAGGFLLAHASYMIFTARRRARAAEGQAPAVEPSDLPPRIVRHSLAARLFHWAMALTMFVLLFTAFLPLVGIKFAWVTLHWIAGIGLAGAILFHIVHATFLMDFWSIWLAPRDLREAWNALQRARGRDVQEIRPGKYPLGNRLYHLGVVVPTLAVIVTGVLMMRRVRTPFFVRDPYLFREVTWGIMYVAHGAAGVLLVGMVIAHIYFALRPEKWWITKSMILGWITRRHYVEHHDPQRWVIPPGDR